MTGDAHTKTFQSVTLPAATGALSGGIAAIGNFDGMHRGHQAVLGDALTRAEAAGRPAYALTFEPHPRDVFRPNEPVFRLTPPAAKARVAAALGLDGLVVVPFDTAFSKRTAEDFVSDVLVDGLAVAGLSVGWNFHFGAGRSGDPGMLEGAGRRYGFEVGIVEPFSCENGEPISSSRIRMLLEAGEIGEAAGLLGYRWFFHGTVVHGEKRGREIGYPTANVRLPAATRLRHGIYAVSVVFDGARHMGVASWGRRPTFDNGAPVFETFVFDFAGDLYGKELTVTPVSFLRPELKFDGIDALVAQMDQDSLEARAVLAAASPVTPLDRILMDP